MNVRRTVLGLVTGLLATGPLLASCTSASPDAPRVDGPSFGAAPATAFGVVTIITELPRPTTAPIAAECATSADAALQPGAIERAVGRVSYAWVGRTEAQTLASDGLSLSVKTTDFDDQVRVMGTAAQAGSIDAVLQASRGMVSSWPRMWATRVNTGAVDPYLLQLTLRADALWLTEVDGEAVLMDQAGNVSVLDLTLPTIADRIAGVFLSAHVPSLASCALPFAKRELVVTNPDAIESWQLGTEEVSSRVEAEMATVADFALRARTCTYPLAFEAWAYDVACEDGSAGPPLWLSYARNLASLDAVHYPSPRNLARLNDLLSADMQRWQREPLVAAFQSPEPDAGLSSSSESSSSVVSSGVPTSDTGSCADAGDGGRLCGITSEAALLPTSDAATGKYEAGTPNDAVATSDLGDAP